MNSFSEMHTDQQEPRNLQDYSFESFAASAIMHDQEDLSNDIPRSLAETPMTAQTSANYFENHGTYQTSTLPGANCCLSEKIWCICKSWTELEGLPLNNNLLRYSHALFCSTLRLTLSKEWDNAASKDCANLRNALLHVNSQACQTLAALLPSPWGGESVLKAIHGRFEPSADDSTYEISKKEHLNACLHDCTEACLKEPRNVPRTRVELLCYAGLKHEALRLCLYYHNCPVLSEESFYGLTVFHLLFESDCIKHLIDEVDNLTCHDGFHLIQLILKDDNNVHPLAECLMHILLVRDFVGPSPYCCSLALMEMWCSLHVKQGTSLTDVEQEVQQLSALATNSAYLYLLVDVLYKQYGRRLLPLYLNIYVHALTIDFNKLEYARQVDCRIAIAELENHMSGTYAKLASLLVNQEDQGLARECELTAFSLEPTIERLTKLQAYALAYPVKWSYHNHHVPRLPPCSGECHCSEKGLCRQDPTVPPWFMTHVPSGILDSNLKGVSKQLLQDLCILIEGPRCRWLTWNMPWRNLHEICMHYLTTAREFRACTDDRRIGIEARLKRLGPFDCSAIPVYRKGQDSSMDVDMHQCVLGNSERKSATENCNEIGTSTVQGEMHIHISGTSEMKTEASEINKNLHSRKNDAAEIGGSLVLATNNTESSIDHTPEQKQDECADLSACITHNIHALSDSCHPGYRRNVEEKVELVIQPEVNQQRLHLRDNGDSHDVKMTNTTDDLQHNGSHSVNDPIVQTQAHLNVLKECNALTDSVTTLLSLQCGQHELLSSSIPHKHCSPTVSPSTNTIPRQSGDELFSDTTARLHSKHTQLTENLSSGVHSTHETHECKTTDILDVRLNVASEPKRISPPPINLESLIAETLRYSPKKSYEMDQVSEAHVSGTGHDLLPLLTPSSSIMVTSPMVQAECTSVTTMAGGLPENVVHQYSAPLLDHLYGKNMLYPFYSENPSVQAVTQDYGTISSEPMYTTILPGISRNISATIAPSYAKPHNGTINETMPVLSNGMINHDVSNIQQAEEITMRNQDIVPCSPKTVNIPKIDIAAHVGLKLSSQPTSTSHAPIHLVSATQSVYTVATPTLGIIQPCQLGSSAQGSMPSKSNPVQTLFKADAIPPQQILQCAVPKINAELMEHTALQSPPTTTLIPQQPVQAYILQPKFSHKKKTLQQLTPVELVQMQQVSKMSLTTQPDTSGEASMVFNVVKKAVPFAQPASLEQIPFKALPSQAYVNTNNVKLLEGQHIQGQQNVALAKPRPQTPLQPTNQSLPQTCAISRVPIARVQCPQTMAPIPQNAMFSQSPRQQVSNNLRPNHAPIKQTPALIPSRSMEPHQSQTSMSKQISSNFQQCANQSSSQTSVSTSRLSGIVASALGSPNIPPLSSGSTSSQQNSSSTASPLINKLHMFAMNQNRLQTRRPFNKPKSDGKPRWTTSYSPHGKMVHHKNGQEKETPVLHGTENANVSKLNSTSTTFSTMNNSAVGARCAIFKMTNATVNCASLTKTTPICRPGCAVSSSIDTVHSATNASNVNPVQVAELVSSEIANSLCTQRILSHTERAAMRAPGVANSTGTGKVSVAMVVTPDLTSCSGIGRATSTVNRTASPTALTAAATSTVSLNQVPGNTNGSITSTVPTMANYKIIEASCPVNYSNVIPSSFHGIIGLSQKVKSSGTKAISLPTSASSADKDSVEITSSLTLSKNCAGAVSNTKDGSSVGKSCSLGNPCIRSTSTATVSTTSYISSSITGTALANTSRTPNVISSGFSSGSMLSAALTSQPTVVLNKLDFQARNIPVVKKCFSPAILSRHLARPAILGKLTSDPQSLTQLQKCTPSQISMQDVSKRKNLVPSENPSVHSSDFHIPATNLKCGPSVNALVSLSKTHLEVSMDKRGFKPNTLQLSSPAKHVFDSPRSPDETHSSLLAKVHEEPQKCFCPICDKVLMRKSLRAHLSKVHKDERNVEFADNKGEEIAKENSSPTQMEGVVVNCPTRVKEHISVLVKEVSIPCDSTPVSECVTDSQKKNALSNHDRTVPNLECETSLDNDDKSTDSSSSDAQTNFVDEMPSSPRSQSDVGMDEKEGSSKKEHSMATTSGEMGENYATRGRVSSRNNKPPQKRSCPCCENTSPNSSAKKCREEKLTRSATSPRKSTHPKISRKTRSSGRKDKSL